MRHDRKPSALALLSPFLELLNLGVVIASGAWFLGMRSALGESVPVQWNAAGEPSRWSTPNELYLFFGIIVLLTATIWITAWVVARRPFDVSTLPADRVARAREAMIAERRLGVRMLELMLVPMNVALALVWLVAVDAAGRADGSSIGIAVLVLLLVVPVIVIGPLALTVRRGREARARVLAARGDGAGDDGWIAGGMLYYAPDDERLIVSKRLGLGGTFNFARGAAWVLLVILLAPAPLIAAVVVFAAAPG